MPGTCFHWKAPDHSLHEHLALPRMQHYPSGSSDWSGSETLPLTPLLVSRVGPVINLHVPDLSLMAQTL